jgi:hypothetical protein
LSIAAAVAGAKRELDGERRGIRLHDELRTEIDRVQSLPLFSSSPPAHPSSLPLLEAARVELELLAALIATVAYWGNAITDEWWLDDIERLGEHPRAGGGMAENDIRRIPGLAMLWAGGVAAAACGRADLLIALATRPRAIPVYAATYEKYAAMASLTPDVIHTGRHDTHWMYRLLRPAFVDRLAVGKETFVEAWERWKILVATIQSMSS